MASNARNLANLVSNDAITIKNAQDRVGIGSTVPTVTLDVDGDTRIAGVITATSFSGNLTGTAGTFSSLSVSGNVSIGGTLTYDDVINVDSIGVITARSGIILGPTSNDLRLGTGATISSPASNRLSFLTSGEEQVRINDLGRVGIGSLSPISIVDILDAIQPLVQIKAVDQSGQAQIRLMTDDQYIIAYGPNHANLDQRYNLAFKSINSSGKITFHTNGNNERARFTSTGRMGLGTTNPSAKLEIKDSAPTLKITGAQNDPLSNPHGFIDFENTNLSDTYVASRIICRGSTDAARTGQLLIQNNTNGTAGGDTNLATRVIIDDVGRVGLFNEDPQANLDVSVGDPTTTVAMINGSITRNVMQINSSTTGISTSLLGSSSWSYGGLILGSTATNHYYQKLHLVGHKHPSSNGVQIGGISAGYQDLLSTNVNSIYQSLGAQITFSNVDRTTRKTSIEFATSDDAVPQNRMFISETGRIGMGNNFEAPESRLEIRDGEGTGTIIRSTSTQTTDTNKALKIRNNSVVNTFSVSYRGNVDMNGSTIGGDRSGAIADDGYVDITTPIKGGHAIITMYSTYDTYPQPLGSGMIYYDTGTTRILAVEVDTELERSPMAGPKLISGGTSTSTNAADFTDAAVTVTTPATSTLRFFNRTGSARAFRITFL
tara:strand:+ start:309 stop:2291 length:1983 start_codon:yes stop_codon:yes gene_type:complete